MADGKSIEIFLVDGDPNGLMTAHIRTRNLTFTIFPRTELNRLKDREDTHGYGVYFLVGSNDSDMDEQSVYIGESENVYSRLINHTRDEEKDFWTRTVVASTPDDNITKGHIRYLESKLIGSALDAGRAQIINGTAPQPPALSESNQSDMDILFDEIKLMLPVLGFSFLRPKPIRPVESSDEPGQGFAVEFSYNGAVASGIFQDGEILVLAGSTVSKRTTSSFTSALQRRREQLISSKIIRQENNSDLLVFEQDCLFSSPSGAAQLIGGASLNGWQMWKISETGETLAEWRDSQLDASE